MKSSLSTVLESKKHEIAGIVDFAMFTAKMNDFDVDKREKYALEAAEDILKRIPDQNERMEHLERCMRSMEGVANLDPNEGMKAQIFGFRQAYQIIHGLPVDGNRPLQDTLTH